MGLYVPVCLAFCLLTCLPLTTFFVYNMLAFAGYTSAFSFISLLFFVNVLHRKRNHVLDLANTHDELSNCLSLDLLSLLVPLSKFNVALTKPNGLA